MSTDLLIDYPSVLVVTRNGYGKQTALRHFRKTSRGASGVKTLQMTTKTGKPALVKILQGGEEELVVTTKQGITIRIPISEIPQLGRATQGVRVIRLETGDEVISGGIN